MSKAAPILATLGLSICISFSPQLGNTATQGSSANLGFAPATSSGRQSLANSDLNDSDEFFQDALRTRGPKRDYSQKIEALLKQMTLQEKVGQMTQLSLEMIVSGHDQTVQIDPAKLQK